MQKTNAPTKFTVPFAASGTKNTIPVAASPTTGLASYTTGFTAVNMEPIASGGVPPFGQDFNGIYYDATKAVLWKQSGFQYAFDSTWAADSNIGGYPAQSLLCRADGKGMWLNLTDNNTTNPDATSPSGWVAVRANAGTSSIAVSGATTTPDPSVLGAPVLIVTGTLTANAALVLPLTAGASWIVENNTTGAFNLTVQGATGTGVQVAQGNPSQVYTDGTNFYATTANVSGLYLPINGNAVSASKLANARNFSISGLATATGVAFDGTGNVVLNVTALAPTQAEINAGLGYVPANDANVVHTSGTETINGVKTFGNIPVATAGIGIGTGTAFIYDSSGSGGLLTLRSVGGFANLDASGRFNVTNGGASFNGNVSVTGTITSTLAINCTTINLTNGATFGSAAASSPTDLSKHISLYGGVIGFSITSGRLNYVAPSSNVHVMMVNGTDILNVSSTGATVTGAVTCTTMNATSSDERFKENIVEVAPRPLHRHIPFVTYKHKADGKQRMGNIAQVIEQHAPEHMGDDMHLEADQVPGVDEGDYKTIDKAGVAHEIATWSAMELDNQTKIIVAMQRAALAQQKTIQNLLNRVAALEAHQESKQ